MTRPTPITVELKDGTTRKMYETDAVDRYLAELSLAYAKEVRHWKQEALRP